MGMVCSDEKGSNVICRWCGALVSSCRRVNVRENYSAEHRNDIAMDITQLILDDHHEQRRLFAMLEQVDRADVDSLDVIWRRLATFLEVHAEAEERHFYPALLRVGTGAG